MCPLRRIHLEKLTYTHNEAAAKALAAYYETPPLAYVRSYGCQHSGGASADHRYLFHRFVLSKAAQLLCSSQKGPQGTAPPSFVLK